MDREKLRESLEPFFVLCEKKGYRIEKKCLKEAFPGITSTSYFLEVYAPWIEGKSCSEVLDTLFDILWDSVDVDVRKNIFAIKVFDKSDELHCYEECEHKHKQIFA